MVKQIVCCLGIALTVCGCGDMPPGGVSDAPLLTETFVSPLDGNDNIDSPVVWIRPGNPAVIATAKTTDMLVVYNAATGEIIDHIGTSGDSLGQFRRPNGIAVIGDLLFVVERDNHRVQCLSLPGFVPLGTAGEEELVRPYGIFGFSTAPGRFTLYITDNYETADEETPPDGELGERVKQFDITITGGGIESRFVRAFGDTTGEGCLRTVESIWGDPGNDVLLVADEHPDARNIKVYTLDGEFTGETMGDGIFLFEPEGIALYASDDGSGWWVATDQDMERNTFHLFDRVSFDHVGEFRGATVANTDGIALTSASFGQFPEGALYAVHNDSGIAAFSWEEIRAVVAP